MLCFSDAVLQAFPQVCLRLAGVNDYQIVKFAKVNEQEPFLL